MIKNIENQQLIVDLNMKCINYRSCNELCIIKCRQLNDVGNCDSVNNVMEFSTITKDDRNVDEFIKDVDTTDLVKRNCSITDESQLVISSQQNRMRIALGVLVRLVLPLCNGVIRGWRGIRGVRLLKALRNIRASRQMLTNMLAFAANTISMSLSSVQVVHHIDPILKIMKLKKGSAAKSIAANSISEDQATTSVQPSKIIIADEQKKCVTLNVLAEPDPGTPIRADIIFIHGLHGSLQNTWKQGLWNSEGRRVKFERAPRPPLRVPKRPRHSRSSLFGPPHLKKRARYAEEDINFMDNCDDILDEDMSTSEEQFTYENGQTPVVGHSDMLEYSFPKFRLRMDDHDTSNNSSFTDPGKLSNNDQNVVKSELEKYSRCWPGDWLPLDCPGVRVIALNYTTDPYLWRPVWVRKRVRTSLTERSREMTDLLIEKRVGYGHPIIWVGHSKGGIFIKQIIVDAWETGRPAAVPLWRSCRGAFFYSVPHRGSPLADFNLPFLRQSIELTEIQKNCPSILDLHRRFVALYDSGHLKIDVFSFVETALTLMSVLYLRIVGIDSADPGIGEVCAVHLDHREICKPRNRNCILYTELTKMINRIS